MKGETKTRNEEKGDAKSDKTELTSAVDMMKQGSQVTRRNLMGEAAMNNAYNIRHNIQVLELDDLKETIYFLLHRIFCGLEDSAIEQERKKRNANLYLENF